MSVCVCACVRVSVHWIYASWRSIANCWRHGDVIWQIDRYSKLVFRRTQKFGARLRWSLPQAMFLSYTFLSNWAVSILLDVVFPKEIWCSQAQPGLMGHVLDDFRLDILRQHVLRNASLLYLLNRQTSTLELEGRSSWHGYCKRRNFRMEFNFVAFV